MGSGAIRTQSWSGFATADRRSGEAEATDPGSSTDECLQRESDRPEPRRPSRGRYHPAMAKLLLNLRHVLEDEADDVRAMLDGARIPYYETPPSMWGISAGGIYVRDNDDVPRAKRLMAEYQAQRRERVRAEHEAAVRAGTAETFSSVLRNEPLRVVLTVLAIIVLLGLVALPAYLLRG
jgi:hypothetical protein